MSTQKAALQRQQRKFVNSAKSDADISRPVIYIHEYSIVYIMFKDAVPIKNTPVYWGKIHPIKQKCSLVQQKSSSNPKPIFKAAVNIFIVISFPSKKKSVIPLSELRRLCRLELEL